MKDADCGDDRANSSRVFIKGKAIKEIVRDLRASRNGQDLRTTKSSDRRHGAAVDRVFIHSRELTLRGRRPEKRPVQRSRQAARAGRSEFLQANSSGSGEPPKGYVGGRYTPDFAKQDPVVCAQIKGDFDKWAPPRIPMEQISVLWLSFEWRP